MLYLALLAAALDRHAGRLGWHDRHLPRGCVRCGEDSLPAEACPAARIDAGLELLYSLIEGEAHLPDQLGGPGRGRPA